MRKVALLLALAAFAVAAPAVVRAQEDGPIRLMGEPTSYTDVIDALDEQDPFDLNITLGYERSLTRGTIQREIRSGVAAGDFRGAENWVDVADHERLRNTLNLGIDVGIYHDLALFARMPLVLSDSRELSVPDGSSRGVVEPLVADVMGGTPMFSIPFQSPTRSGIDYVEAGIAFAPFNQYRDPEFPTWVLMFAGKFSVGEPMHPCADATGCAGGAEAGISEGTNAIRLETRASRRYRYLEPYAGLLFEISWPGSADDLFEPGGELAGFMNTMPPRIGEVTAGVTLIPWEHPGRWQRFSIDLRLQAAYVSEGHGYSPLFDALGTSNSMYLTTPSYEYPPGTPGFPDPRQVSFTGLTDMQSHGRIGGRASIEMWAARYVRFMFGAGLFWASPYIITFTDACNPNEDPNGVDDPRQGTCRSGIINPHHRPVIDLPGNRFRVDGELTFDLYATATAQF